MNIKRAIGWTVGGLAAAVLILTALYAILQTPSAKKVICSTLSGLLSSKPHAEVQIEGLQGRIPSDVRIERISLGDEQGPWCVFHDIHLEWSPLDLLWGRVRIEALEAARVEIFRKPSKSETKEEQKALDPFSVMDDLSLVTVERFNIAEIHLHQAVLNEEGVFKVEGEFPGARAKTGTVGSLQVRRIDPGSDTLLKWTVEGTDRPRVFNTSLTFEESPGGWVSTLLGLEKNESLSLMLRGSGGPDVWNGDLRASFGKFGSIESEVNASLEPVFSVSTEGSTIPGQSIIPSDLKVLIGPEIRFSAEARLEPDRAELIHRAQFDIDAGRLSLDGEFQYRTHELHTNASLSVDDLNVIQPLLQVPISGSLTARTRVEGFLSASVADISVRATDVKIGDAGIHDFETDFRLRSLIPSDRAGRGIRIVGKGLAEGLTGSLESPLLLDSVEWQWGADVRSGREVLLDFLSIKSRNHSVQLAGTIDPSEPSGSIVGVGRVENLETLSGWLGIETRGSGVLQVQATGSARTRSATAQVRGTMHLPEGISTVPASVLGSDVALSAQIRVDRGEEIAFPQVDLDGATFRFQGDGKLDIPEKTVTGMWRLSIPSLRPFSVMTGKPVSGSIEAKGWIEGPATNPVCMAGVDGKSITWMGREIPQVLSRVLVLDAPTAPVGAVRLTVEKDGTLIQGATDFSFRNRTLEFSSMVLEAPGTHLGGELTLDIEQSSGRGNLDATSDDLSALAPLLGEAIGGSAAVSARFAWEKAHQEVSGHIEGSDLKTPFFKVGSGRMDVRIENPLHAPKGKLDLKLSGFERPGLKLDAVSLDARDSKDGFRFDMNANGNAYLPFEVKAAGSVNFEEQGAVWHVGQVSGTCLNTPFSLLTPIVLRQQKGGFTLDEFLFDVGGGSLSVKSTFDPQQVLFRADLKRIPLRGIALAQESELDATASGLLEIRGPVREPIADIQLRLDQCRIQNRFLNPNPPFDVAINAGYKDRLVKADAGVSGLSEKPTELSIQAPVGFSLSPFDLSFFEQEPIQGHLYAETTFDRLLTLIPIGDRSLSGQLTADLDLGGSLSSPQLNGTLRCDHGSLEEFKTGTILKDLEVEIEAKGRRLEIRKAGATDGEAGVIAADGWMELDHDGNYPAEIKLTLSDAVLVRRDDVTGAADGKIELLKTDRTLTVRGKLDVNRLEVNIPDRFVPETAKLEIVDVTEGGREALSGEPDPKQAQATTGSPVALSMDIEAGERAFIRGWGLDSEWKGRLSIRGTTDSPIIQGALSVIRGRYDLLDKRFDLTSGEVRFSGASPPSPRIELEAESKITDGTAYVRISGSLSSPTITFRSDPPLPEDEIVARLLFGRGITQITPLQALRLAQALRSLSGGDNRKLDLLSRTRNFLGLDQLDLRGGEGSVGDAAVGVGKYLTEDIYVDLEKGLAEATGKVTVTMELTPNITLESEAGAEAGAGIGINWKLDY
ncbi:MAG: translocation/assembly module TamB domain-containing protein [Deltaproteobacteria bacterium]|nr:translocation/assembly module TamB domain-containing protein [Deltaproteobacteria bacterium]